MLFGDAHMDEAWSLPWQELEVTLGLRNALSLRSLNITSANRATAFFAGCGFNLNEASHQKELEQFFGEALFFVRHQLFTVEERRTYPVPHEILIMEDMRKLLQLASLRAPRRRYARLWACTVLKVMQAFVNLEYSGKLKELNFAKEQIFSQIKSFLHESAGGALSFVFRNSNVHLKSVDWKESKTKTSILLKLLHKPESVVDEVFDFLGVRFVVPHENQVPLLLGALIEADIIVPHQVLGMRTRNSLLNLKQGKDYMALSRDLLNVGTVEASEFLEMCGRIPWGFSAQEAAQKKWKNTFSSSDYRAVQLTTRQLVRAPNPARALLASLATELRHYRGTERDWDPISQAYIPKELIRYFPFEVQIMDEGSYDISKFGPASHERYKHLQLLAVRERVLGSILKMSPEKLATQEF